MKEIKKPNRELFILLIVIFEILLLVNMTPANSYMIHQTDPKIGNSKIVEKNEFDELISLGAKLLISFFSIKQIGIVSAQAGCCLDTCIDVEDLEDCGGGSTPTKCDSTDSCRIGTCVDEENGECSANAPKFECESEEGNWYFAEINKVSDCMTGCCTLNDGEEKEFVSKINCKVREGIFDSSISQAECRIQTEERGACVVGDQCTFVTEQRCDIDGGEFYIRSLCSNSDLGTNCVPTELTTCYKNKVYFIDSCGNLANVYDSSRINDAEYWNFVQSTECDVNLNEKSSLRKCGNCNLLNNICDTASKAEVNPDYGDYACKDLNCIDEEDGNKKRQNTESWCVYESYVGESKDVVGSEHRLRYCDQGEIKTDPCGEFRSQICAEKIVSGLSQARCRVNEGFMAFSLEPIPYEYDEDEGKVTNQDEVDEYIEECNDLSDSRIQSVDFYEWDHSKRKITFFQFDICVPEYPPGLEHWDGGSNSGDICGLATVECTALVTKRRCKGNCECLTQEWAEAMNDYCISLGDCGGYVNVEGEYTKNFRTFDVDTLGDKFTDRRRNEDYDANGDISESKKESYSIYADDSEMGNGNLPTFISSNEEGYWGGGDPFDNFEYLLRNSENYLVVYRSLSGVFGTVGGILSSLLPHLFAGIAEGGSVGGPVGVLIAALVLVILSFIFLFLKPPREVTVKFTCYPWEAPTGGDNCDKCNDDPLRPCTEYKCKSLGTACALITEDELYEAENPVCINKYPDDTTPPQIIFESIANEDDYKITNNNNGISIRTSDGECIKEATSLNFKFKTEDEGGNEDFAKCVYNLEPVDPPSAQDNFYLAGDYFNELNFFSSEHNFGNRLPFVSSLEDISGDTPGEREGELNMYVRCMDYAGNFNRNEYIVNLCLKEGEDNEIAIITNYDPRDGSSIKFGETTQPLTISLNEPAECKWTNRVDKPYNEMEHLFDCEDFLGFPDCVDLGNCVNGYCEGYENEADKEDFTCESNEDCAGCLEEGPKMQAEWKCSTTLTGLTEIENNIYIKCKDQPWISDEEYSGPWTEENRNINDGAGFEYTLYLTQTALNIDSVSPSGEIVKGGDASEIELEVKTSGGISNGISKCRYDALESPSNINFGDFFSKTNSITHRQTLNWEEGSYNLLITCKDDVGNQAVANTVFDLKVDRTSPIITRAYYDGGNLKLITNEKAKCYFDYNNCYYNIEDGTIITNTLSLVHTIPWEAGVAYYIRCEDEFGNMESGCTTRIIPSA